MLALFEAEPIRGDGSLFVLALMLLLMDVRRGEDRSDNRWDHFLLGETSRLGLSLSSSRVFDSEVDVTTGLPLVLPLTEIELRQLRIRSADRLFLASMFRDARWTEDPIELRRTEPVRASIFLAELESHDSVRRFW
jgi:hypothetical protein